MNRGKNMYADSEKINWLLENQSQYRIAKKTGVAQQNLSKLVNNKISLEGITFETASKLTEYAEQLMSEE